MKVWFDHYYDEFRDREVEIGFNWYKHHHKHKHRGFTVQFFFLGHVFSMTTVNDFDLYQRDTNQGPYYKSYEQRFKERLDRLKKIKEKRKK